MIKKIIKTIIRNNSDVRTLVFNKCNKDSDVFKYAVRYSVLNYIKNLYRTEDKITVKSGPFSGLIYPDFSSTGSALCPKLLGTYEKELHTIIFNILNRQYKYVLDVGCAEGYYAVGLAQKLKNAEIYAYDINEYARKLCLNMSAANGQKINIRDKCTDETLKKFSFDNSLRSLIICDCEGYERNLFTKSNINNLANVECLIEVHDWLQNETSTKNYLLNLFKETHNYKVIIGDDDFEKAYTYSVSEVNKLSIYEKFYAFAEERRRCGVWLYFEPKE